MVYKKLQTSWTVFAYAPPTSFIFYSVCESVFSRQMIQWTRESGMIDGFVSFELAPWKLRPFLSLVMRDRCDMNKECFELIHVKRFCLVNVRVLLITLINQFNQSPRSNFTCSDVAPPPVWENNTLIYFFSVCHKLGGARGSFYAIEIFRWAGQWAGFRALCIV